MNRSGLAGHDAALSYARVKSEKVVSFNVEEFNHSMSLYDMLI